MNNLNSEPIEIQCKNNPTSLLDWKLFTLWYEWPVIGSEATLHIEISVCPFFCLSVHKSFFSQATKAINVKI